MHDERLVLARQRHEPLHEVEVDDTRRRVVRERDDQDARRRLRPLERVGDLVVELVVAPAELDLDHARAGQDGRVDVDRIGRRGHDRRVARLDEHPHQVREPFLGADRRHRLGLGVELDAEAIAVEVADRAAQLRDAATGRVAVVARVRGRLGQLLDRRRRRGEVGVAEPEVDHVLPGTAQLQLQLLGHREDVRRERRDTAKLHRPHCICYTAGLA